MAPGSLRSNERLGLDAQDRRPGEAGNSAIVQPQGVASSVQSLYVTLVAIPVADDNKRGERFPAPSRQQGGIR
jgi:hypothetical protein